ncbi:putative transposase-associated domain-containing protein [Tanacetum coccineum]
MDRSWMYLAPRASAQYVQGVESFLDFAFEKSRNHGKILCPCIDCLNMSFLTRAVVYDHLICSGFKKNYSIWKDHGEVCKASSSRMMSEDEGLFSHDMDGLLGDLFLAAPLESRIHIGESEINSGPINSEPMDKNEKKKFDDLLKEAEQKIYMDAKYTKLSCLVHLYHLKSLNGWSNKSFSMLLEFLHDLLPIGNLMPKTTHHVKKILANLGLSYEKIHACPNGCMLFWNGNEKEEVCSICGASRWKSAPEVASNDPDEVAPNDPDEVVGPQKKKAANILRWFPLKPRLQRLFMSSKTASLMNWHQQERKKDGKLRHPADGLAWKDFDQRYPEFSSDPRNIRLGPGNKIDVYMQPLIKELEDLWEKGVETFDVATKQMFRLKAAVHSTISDFPGYANLSGWSTKGEYACPVCAFDKSSKWLEHGRKWCYMGHRRWLQHDHCWRKDTKSFDGDEELRYAPAHRSGEDILNHLDHIDFLNENVDKSPWKKKSIFFKLPYWKHLLLPHSLDVMHIEKNVCDNITGTLLAQQGKSKDNMKARLDLQKMGIRKELHPKKHPRSDNMYIPQACYVMTQDEKDVFLQTLKSIKPPDEYSSNISRCVQIKERKLIGMKSYDCHMLMQEYLPIAIRGTLPNHVSIVLIELCDFFRHICLKDLTEDDLEFLESRVAVTLCKMEKIFPPSFLDLSTLKSYVNNKAFPEGSIAEGYLARESLTFCSRYFSGVETLFTRPLRNDDDDDQNKIEASNSLCPGRALGLHMHSNLPAHKRKSSFNSEIDEKSLKQAHRYVLFNVESITHFRREHKSLIKGQNRKRRLPEFELEKIHCEKFSAWFQKRVERLEEQMDPRVIEEVKWLARGPNDFVKRYSGNLVKGYRFHTKNHDSLLKSQNSRVVVTVMGTSPAQGMVNFYGSLKEIVELNYSGKIRVVLFRCDWVDINQGCKRDEFGITLVNFSYVTHTGVNLHDDPFVLASQADKVFYAQDPTLEGWFAVRHVKVSDAFNMGCNGDQNSLYSIPRTFDVPSLHRIDVDGDDGIDAAPNVEDEESEDEDDENS